MVWACALAQHTGPQNPQYSVKLKDPGSGCIKFMALGSKTHTHQSPDLQEDKSPECQPGDGPIKGLNVPREQWPCIPNHGEQKNSQSVVPIARAFFSRRISELGEFVCLFTSSNVPFCQANLQYKRMAYRSIMERENTKQTKASQHQSEYYLWQNVKRCREWGGKGFQKFLLIKACQAIPRPHSPWFFCRHPASFHFPCVFSALLLHLFVRWLVCAALVKSACCILQQGEDTEQGLNVLP